MELLRYRFQAIACRKLSGGQHVRNSMDIPPRARVWNIADGRDGYTMVPFSR